MAKKMIEYAPKSLKIEEAIPLFISSQNAKGLSEKTLNNYQGHFRSIAHHLDFSITFDELTKQDLDTFVNTEGRYTASASDLAFFHGKNSCSRSSRIQHDISPTYLPFLA